MTGVIVEPSGVRQLSWAEVCDRRLARHGLAGPLDGGVADAVAAMSGAHAQVMSAAELSVGLRLPDATRVDVRDALWTSRTVVKTYGPRGTVHLLRASDLPMWTAALSAVPAQAGPMPPHVRMTPEQTDAVVAAIDEVLDGAELTVDELGAAVVDAVGSWAGDLVMPAFGGMWPRWRQAITTAANRGALVFGPNRGRRTTFTSPRRWLPDLAAVPGAPAAAELARRCLHAYGPATPHQFARWLGAPRPWATALFDSLAAELAQVRIGETAAWMLHDDVEAPREKASGVRLLPYFDAYTVGAHPRDLLFPGRAAERGLTGGQAGNVPVLLVDGTVAGIWHQRRTGSRVAITVEPVRPLTPAQRRELDHQVERIGQITEATPTLTIGTVTTGPHA